MLRDGGCQESTWEKEHATRYKHKLFFRDELTFSIIRRLEYAILNSKFMFVRENRKHLYPRNIRAIYMVELFFE